MDIRTKRFKKNAFRATKVRGYTASRVRVALPGRAGKRNPRLGEDFIKWVDEDSSIRMILNTYGYVERHIDRDAPGGKERIGYIVDRTGFEELPKWSLRDVRLPAVAEVSPTVYWSGVKYL